MTRSISSYIFYFVDNGIAGTKDFSELFFSAIDSILLEIIRTSELIGSLEIRFSPKQYTIYFYNAS